MTFTLENVRINHPKVKKSLWFFLITIQHIHFEIFISNCFFSPSQDGFVTGDQISYLKKGLYEDLARIRPNAVSLVDSFDVSERELNSVLGRRDGNVYEALYAWAKKSELNRTEVTLLFYPIRGWPFLLNDNCFCVQVFFLFWIRFSWTVFTNFHNFLDVLLSEKLRL